MKTVVHVSLGTHLALMFLAGIVAMVIGIVALQVTLGAMLLFYLIKYPAETISFGLFVLALAYWKVGLPVLALVLLVRYMALRGKSERLPDDLPKADRPE